MHAHQLFIQRLLKDDKTYTVIALYDLEPSKKDDSELKIAHQFICEEAGEEVGE